MTKYDFIWAACDIKCYDAILDVRVDMYFSSVVITRAMYRVVQIKVERVASQMDSVSDILASHQNTSFNMARRARNLLLTQNKHNSRNIMSKLLSDHNYDTLLTTIASSTIEPCNSIFLLVLDNRNT